MSAAVILIMAAGVALPHILRLERSPAAAAAALWAVSLALRALLAMLVVLYVAFFLPATQAFGDLTHWCWHTVLPVLATHLGLEGHRVGDAATVLPGLIVIASLLSVAFGVIRGARAIRHLLARETLGPGPSDSLIVAGPDVVLAAAGLTRPQVVVSAGALLELEDDELAAGLDHEHGHIARRHRFVLVFAELCRGIGRFVPGSGRAMRELIFHLERDADQWALERRHDRLALASVICKSVGVRPELSPALTALSGRGTKERLVQLIDDGPIRRSRAGVAMLNTLATVMVCSTVLMAALVPSTALAGAQQLGAGDLIRHCAD
jgi:hypothetical protein